MGESKIISIFFVKNNIFYKFKSTFVYLYTRLLEAVAAEEQAARWIAERRLRPSSGASASERWAALRDRVRSRQRAAEGELQ